jgi:hypothetical protein
MISMYAAAGETVGWIEDVINTEKGIVNQMGRNALRIIDGNPAGPAANEVVICHV